MSIGNVRQLKKQVGRNSEQLTQAMNLKMGGSTRGSLYNPYTQQSLTSSKMIPQKTTLASKPNIFRIKGNTPQTTLGAKNTHLATILKQNLKGRTTTTSAAELGKLKSHNAKKNQNNTALHFTDVYSESVNAKAQTSLGKASVSKKNSMTKATTTTVNPYLISNKDTSNHASVVSQKTTTTSKARPRTSLGSQLLSKVLQAAPIFGTSK